MKKICRSIHYNRFFCTCLLITFAIVMIYLSNASANVPSMDYWLYFNSLVEKMYNGGVTFSDLWNANGIQRTPVQLFLFLCNVRLFRYNSQIGTFLGLLLSIVSAIIVYRELLNFIDIKFPIVFNMGIIISLLSLYNLGQWEIINTEFYCGFELRRIAFLLSFIFVNKMLHEKKKYAEYDFELSVFFVLTICTVSAAYFGAYLLAILCALVVDLFREKNRHDYRKTYIILIIGLFIGFFLYTNGLALEMETPLIINWEFVKNFFYGFAIFTGNAILGCANLSCKGLAIAGIFVCSISLIAIYIYIRYQIYKTSYIPMILGVYVCMLYAETYIGLNRGGWSVEYLSSSRYIYDSTLIILAVGWIFIKIIENNYFLEKKKSITQTVLCVLSLTFLLSGVIYTDYNQWHRATYIKSFYNERINEIKKIDELDDAELHNMGYDALIIRNAIDIMKKYKLYIYRYE